eukprot:2562832-Rhodomonas_salina.2
MWQRRAKTLLFASANRCLQALLLLTRYPGNRVISITRVPGYPGRAWVPGYPGTLPGLGSKTWTTSCGYLTRLAYFTRVPGYPVPGPGTW